MEEEDWPKQAELEPNINRCIRCGDIIEIHPDASWRKRRSPLRCFTCVDEMDRDGTLQREDYSRWEARFVL